MDLLSAEVVGLLSTQMQYNVQQKHMGLVELGVGLIPGGGGTKEMALRASDAYYEGDIELPRLKEYF